METKEAAGAQVAPNVVPGVGDSVVDVNAGVVDIQGSPIGGTLKKTRWAIDRGSRCAVGTKGRTGGRGFGGTRCRWSYRHQSIVRGK
jgi:hypothetical protein